MKNIVCSLLLLMSLFTTGISAEEYSHEQLRRMAARMLMVGFKGDSITNSCDAAKYIRDLGVGGIILFDVDLTGEATLGSRNITSAPRLQRLTAALDSMANYPLLIALDQEGGKVQRLKPRYGFASWPSAGKIGRIDNPDTTRLYASTMAAALAEMGINVNLAPDIDIFRTDCPVIGALDRAYSAQPSKITEHASIFIDEHSKRGIICALKHFPGHGSATNDSHYGLTDVTDTWTVDELQPFADAIRDGRAGIIMTAHIFNRNIDANYPATLSEAFITGLLRNQLGYNGVVMTDDMYMKGIIDNYSIDEALCLAINAGADIIVAGNNISTGFEPLRPYHLVDIIVQAVEDGRIPASRIAESAARISALAESIVSN